MPNKNFNIPVLTVFGVGLIGGSLAMALRQAHVVDEIVGFGCSDNNLQIARENGVIDTIATSVETAVERADVIVMATPVNSIASLMREISPWLQPNTVITDVGSVKVEIMRQSREALGDKWFNYVPGHPVAGKEKSGVAAAQSDLFVDHKVILTPSVETSSENLDFIRQMWTVVGAEVCDMDAEDHDRVLGLTSHLPHVLAYVMMDMLANSRDKQKGYEVTASGFYDFTRIASSDSQMWRDICSMNESHIRQHLEEFIQRLNNIEKMLSERSYDDIEQLFAASKQARSTMLEKRKCN